MNFEERLPWRHSPSVEELIEKIKKLLSFLEPLLPLANCHLVQFLTEDQWNNLLPRHLQEDLLHIPMKNLNLIPSAELYDTEDLALNGNKCSHLHRFLLSVRKFHLDKQDVLTPVPELKVEKNPMDKVISLSMNKKKAYEVRKISQFIGNICNGKNIAWMVDIGSGLGYLSSILLLEYNYNILALDSSESNILSSMEQCHKMQTILNRYRKKESQRSDNEVKDKSHTSSPFECEISNTTEKNISLVTTRNKKLLKGVTKFIKTDDNLSDIILSQFKPNVNGKSNKNDIGNVGIVGLHTCGNLSPVSLKLFVSNPCAKFLCNVGCCYHLLEEEFCIDHFYINKERNSNCDNRYHSEDMDPFHKKNKSTETGFPLSSYLKSIRFSLGRNARNLASKPSNTLSQDDRNLKLLFWRSLFEIIVNDLHGCWPEGAFVGRGIGKRSLNFYEYCQQCLNNIGLDIKISEDIIYSYYEKYKCEEDLFIRFSFFKASLAPLIENLINMDRLLYLKEQGYADSHLVRVFDSALSPRCTAVVSFKE
ncbi:UNVERIFIED_CONTAM: hypothetical protein RMT77_008669 [Armadillidium vulgare]